MKRVFNFSAGPAILPVSVLEEVSQGVLEIENSGMSILEVSHRSELYEKIHNDAKCRILGTLGLSESDFSVLFFGGGASLQFLSIPMNLLRSGETADYVHTGEWSSKAIKEAKAFGKVNVVASSEADKFSSIPTNLNFSEEAKYVHITSNNTVEGTQWSRLPDTKAPLVADMSSEIFSRQLDYKKFGLIYAGAQKNAGPAGVTLVIVRKDVLESSRTDIPTMLAYQTYAKNNSLYNTPPVFPIYVVGLVCKWIEEEGGISFIEQRNQRKAKLIYSALTELADVYDIVVKRPEDRSNMNITFRLKNTEREKEFLKGALERGLDGLKGHRSVGGFRASVYNAFPEEGAHVLVQYLKEFAGR